MRTRTFALAGALALAGSGLAAAPASASVGLPQLCTYHIAVKHNGQHLMTVTAGDSEANWRAGIIWLPEVPPPDPGFAAYSTSRRLTGTVLTINLERAGIYVPGIRGVVLRPGPRMGEDNCRLV